MLQGSEEENLIEIILLIVGCIILSCSNNSDVRSNSFSDFSPERTIFESFETHIGVWGDRFYQTVSYNSQLALVFVNYWFYYTVSNKVKT